MLVHLIREYWKFMNPHLQTQEIKQLKITNVVLREHKRQIQEENQNNINCLEEIHKQQRKSLETLNIVLGIRKETRRL